MLLPQYVPLASTALAESSDPSVSCLLLCDTGCTCSCLQKRTGLWMNNTVDFSHNTHTSRDSVIWLYVEKTNRISSLP